MSHEGEEPIPTERVEAMGSSDPAPTVPVADAPTVADAPADATDAPATDAPTVADATDAPTVADAPADAADAPTVADAPADATDAPTVADAADAPTVADAPATDEPAPDPVPATSIRSSRTLAAFLSFLIPGSGQFLSGRIAAGVFFLLPVLVVTVVGLVLASGDPGEAFGIVLQPEVLLGIVVADVVLFMWRATAIIDAWWNVAADVPRSPLSAIILAILLVVTGATHLAIGSQVMAVHDTVDAIFASDSDDDGFGDLPEPTPTPTAKPTSTSTTGRTATSTPMLTASPSPTPVPTPKPGPLADGRLDLLLVGGDAGPGRWSLRTDTMVVLSVDTKSGEAALFSIPRNMVNVPLPKESRKAFACKCYPQLLNSLYVYASAHPGQFPGNDNVRGLRALQMAVGTLVGRKLDGMVVVKLQGFVKLVNAIGGIDVTVPRSIFDARYPLEDGTRYVQIYIRAGKQHMTGRKALMYARSRHQDSDYGRMDRQQIVLSALGKKLLKGDLVTRLPKLLKIAKDNLWTNLKTADLPDLAKLAELTDLKGMAKVRFIPPRYPEYLDKRSIKAIRSVVKHVFDKAKPLKTPAPSG